MKRFRRIVLSLVLAVGLLVAFVLPASAANTAQVSITVTAQVIAITNDKSTWAIGVVAPSDVKYFSADGNEDDDYSTITNTGNVVVDVKIQGTDFEGGDYDWTLASSAGDQTYSLYANKQATPTNYNVEVKKTAPYSTITADTGLAVGGTNKWSMKFTAPTSFNANDPGTQKTATVTLVASKHG